MKGLMIIRKMFPEPKNNPCLQLDYEIAPTMLWMPPSEARRLSTMEAVVLVADSLRGELRIQL